MVFQIEFKTVYFDSFYLLSNFAGFTHIIFFNVLIFVKNKKGKKNKEKNRRRKA